MRAEEVFDAGAELERKLSSAGNRCARIKAASTESENSEGLSARTIVSRVKQEIRVILIEVRSKQPS